MGTFDKDQLGAVFNELEVEHAGSPDYEQLLRAVHLGVALCDAGREMDASVDPRAASLIDKHRP